MPILRGKLVDDGAEEARCPGIHVLDRVDAETVDVGIGDPELVHLAQGPESRGGDVVIDVAVPQVDILQVEKVAFQVFGIVIPVVDAPFAGEDLGMLEFLRP